MRQLSVLVFFLNGVLLSVLLIQCSMPVYTTPIRKTRASMPFGTLALGDLQIGPAIHDPLPGIAGTGLLRRFEEDYRSVRGDVLATLKKQFDKKTVVYVQTGNRLIQAELEFSTLSNSGFYGRGFKLDTQATRKAAATAGADYVVVPVVELKKHSGQYYLTHSTYCPEQMWATANLFVLVIDRSGVVVASSEDFGPVGKPFSRPPARLHYDIVDLFRVDLLGSLCRLVPYEPADFKQRLKGLPYQVARSFI